MYETRGGTSWLAKAPADGAAPRADQKVGALARARHAMLSDDRLAKQAAAGDIGAFEAIFSRYRDDLYRFCVGILREPQDAQDAVQNTMIRVMRALPGERRVMQLKPWLYRIAHNEAVELRRRERPVEELPVTIDDVGARTDERAEENGRLRTLLADIADLPERQRASLVLREVNGLDFGEIGAALGTSPGAVRQALYEARRGLAEMDDGRDMQCDLATRMVSDADGRPRDRGVRAHLRDCSPCRRFQTEIRERTRTFAAIAPLPAIAAVGALNAALAGSGATAGGSGAAAAAGGAGAGAGVAGSIGATALLKPAAGLLTVLAIGTAAVGHGAIFEAGRHGSRSASPDKVVLAPERRVGKGLPRDGHAIAWHSGKRGNPVPTAGQVDSASDSALTPAQASPTNAAEDLGASTIVPWPGAGAESRSEREVAAPTVTKSPALTRASHDEAVVPGAAPIGAPANGGDSGTGGGGNPPSQAKQEAVPPGQAKKELEPVATELEAPESTRAEGPKAAPGQAKKEAVPPGQTKKQAETAANEPTSESAAPATPPAHVPPGQAKKESEAAAPATTPSAPPAHVPPGQAKKGESAPASETSEASNASESAKAPAASPDQATTEEATTK